LQACENIAVKSFLTIPSWLKHRIPSLDWLAHYEGKHLRGDVLAGLVVATLLIPQAMAYALLADLPPQVGLYASQVIGGTIRARPSDDGLLLQAQNDLTTAYVDAGNRPVPGANNLGVVDNQLGGKTLSPGVCSFGHAATANLIVQSGSSVVLMNGASSCDVFWWVGSSATIGTYSDFVGNIMADQSIALQTGATLDGPRWQGLLRLLWITIPLHPVNALKAISPGLRFQTLAAQCCCSVPDYYH